MYNFDLIIHGCGLAGASLAVALAPLRKRIALVETVAPQHAKEPHVFDVRVYAISPANTQWLESIGIWKHLEQTRIMPVSRMHVSGNAGGKIEFSAYDAGISTLATIIESSMMLHELWENLKRQTNVTLFCPARPANVCFNHPAAEISAGLPLIANSMTTITLEDGRILSAPLIVAADGRDSWMRRVAGLEAFDTPYHEMGIVANFKCANKHRGTAWQWFHDESVLAYLPLPGERISIVWAAPEAQAHELLELPPEKFAQQVGQKGLHVLGDLEQITAPAAFPLRLIRVPRIIAPRLALIGDAAHGIHPLSGHGINLGFQDARILADLLSTACENTDIGGMDFLRRYQRARREEITALQTSTDMLRRFFKSHIIGGTPILNAGLSTINHLPWVKSLLIRYATSAFQ